MKPAPSTIVFVVFDELEPPPDEDDDLCGAEESVEVFPEDEDDGPPLDVFEDCEEDDGVL
jgi:hypothetical protein